MFTGKQDILSALQALGRQLALADATPVSLLVCGGAALNCQDLLVRATRDVDVIGLVNDSAPPSWVADDLPDELRRVAEYVAVHMGIQSDWLNANANLVKSHWGLPPGIMERAQAMEFGPCLRVLFLHRLDLLTLKFIGALDKEPAEALRHFADVANLEPTREEIELAVQWVLARPTSVEFQNKVRQVSERLGLKTSSKVVKAATVERLKRPRRPSSNQPQKAANRKARRKEGRR